MTSLSVQLAGCISSKRALHSVYERPYAAWNDMKWSNFTNFDAMIQTKKACNHKAYAKSQECHLIALVHSLRKPGMALIQPSLCSAVGSSYPFIAMAKLAPAFKATGNILLDSEIVPALHIASCLLLPAWHLEPP